MKFAPGLVFLLALSTGWAAVGGEVDALIARTNKSANIALAPQGLVDDPTFLRRVYVDLVGRIPTADEVTEFAKWPVADRRAKLVDKLLQDPRFADRWTIFYADMLRMRSQASGGQAMIAWVHQAVETGMPYDEMCRRLIYSNGKANKTPEAGYVLGDNADPMALAAVTSQVFMGVRIACAQCHDHPFDVWKRRDFYDLAAFFGRTRRYESQLTRVVYATEMDKSAILWPPEGDAPDDERKIIDPKFPFPVDLSPALKPDYVVRLQATRKAKADALAAAKKDVSLDDLLESTSQKVAETTKIGGPKNEAADTKKDIRSIDIAGSIYKRSEFREDLAAKITDPRNRFFSRALVNRVWKELIGRGFVEPVDDFREDNPPAHPAALDYLADEFVASDYDLRALVKLIVTSDAYQRAHAPADADQLARQEMEVNLLATPMRRMIAEAMFDSIIVAGRLFTPKHSPGKNEKVLIETVRVPKTGGAKPGDLAQLTQAGGGAMAGMSGPMAMAGGGYALETAIEVDFSAVLKDAAKEDEVAVEQMRVMSREEVEAMRMAREGGGRGRMEYEVKQVKKVIDDNPVYPSSLRMQSPAPEGHFLRVFGQPNRSDLGDNRDDSASMRQALMMLNGRVTHEAARVGDLEPMYNLLTGKDVNIPAAIKLAYLEILTRRPSAEEMKDAAEIIASGGNPLDGMADLRWVLLNCNEFRFLP